MALNQDLQAQLPNKLGFFFKAQILVKVLFIMIQVMQYITDD